MTDDLSPAAARTLEAHQRAEGLARAALEAQQARNAAVVTLHRSGWSYHRIAVLLGLTASRVGAIITAHKPRG